jgi:hypothetical protein
MLRIGGAKVAETSNDESADATLTAVLRDTAELAAGLVTGVAAGEAAAVVKPDAATIAAAERVAAAQDPYLRRKQLQWFDVLDGDGDGVVTPEDTLQFAHRLARLTGHAEDSPRAQQMVATVNQLWHKLALRSPWVLRSEWVPDPKRLNAEQFVTLMANDIATRPDKTFQYIGVITNLAFAMADGDHDGRVTRDDVIRLGTEVLRADRNCAEHAWAVLDADADGYLSYAEVLKAVTDCFMSPDPQAPGNLALGRI